jgi:hypothetical protein
MQFGGDNTNLGPRGPVAKRRYHRFPRQHKSSPTSIPMGIPNWDPVPEDFLAALLKLVQYNCLPARPVNVGPLAAPLRNIQLTPRGSAATGPITASPGFPTTSVVLLRNIIPNRKVAATGLLAAPPLNIQERLASKQLLSKCNLSLQATRLQQVVQESGEASSSWECESCWRKRMPDACEGRTSQSFLR